MSASQDAMAKWAASTLGPQLKVLAPTPAEIASLYAYAQQHPGTTGQSLAGLLSNYRQSLAQGQPLNSPLVQPIAGTDPGTTTPSSGAFGVPGNLLAQASDQAGSPTATTPSTTATSPVSPTAPKATAATGSYGAQIAAALKATAAGTSSAVLDQFAATSPVYMQSPVVSAPNAGLPGAARSRLSSGDQLATGTGDTTGGVQSATYQSVLTDYYKMDAGNLKALKQSLWAGGFYPAGTPQSVIDSATPDVITRSAYLIAVQQAARLAEAGQKTTVQAVIASGNPDPAKSTGAAANGPYSITSPVDLKEALNSSAQTMLGRDLSPDEIKTFASLYNGMESQASIRQQAMNANNQQGAIVAPPSPTAAADDYIQTHLANQAQAYGAVTRQQAFFSMLGAL